LLFGYFNAIEGSSENAAELLKALKDAEEAIKTANDKMSQLRTWWHGYIVEYNTITGMGLSTALTMWSPLDVSKGTVTIQGPVDRLFQLEASIFATIIYFDDLNELLRKRVSTRDAALTNYNSATSHQRTVQNTPDYYSPIPECRLPCKNSCGVIFSSNDVGLDKLSYAAANNHKKICGEGSSVSGCSVKHWTCDGKSKEYKKHQIVYCGRNISYWSVPSGSFSGKVIGKCGAPYRKCTTSTGTHYYEAVLSYNPSSRGKYRSGYRAATRVTDPYSGKHLWGTVDPPSASFHGPTKYSKSIGETIDKTPDCSTCIDGSKHCPNASKHSGGGSASVSPGFSPASGSYTASAGSTHTGTVTGPSIYGAYLYVNGTQKGWFGGTQSTTSLPLSYTFPSDASGSYTMKALVYPWKGNTYGTSKSYSYTVTVGSSTTTTSTPSTPSTPSTTDDDDDDDDDDSSTTTSSPYSLSASSTGSPFEGGDTITLTLSSPVYESYYSVDWSLVSPVYSTSIHLSNDYASGYGSSESSVSYTFPSGYRGITCLKRSFTRMET
jgi:hypothetical protein